MQLGMHDYLEGKPAHGHENFSKREKDPRLSNAIVSKKTGQKITNKTSSNDWSGQQKKT